MFYVAAKPLQSKYSADTSAKKYTFEDVQGVEEAKEEIKEIVEFLRDPARFQKLGAKLPTGKNRIEIILLKYITCTSCDT